VAGINRAPARLDLSKLEHINAHYMKALNAEEVVAKSAPFFERAGVNLDDAKLARLGRAAAFLKERAPTLAAIVEASAFLFLERPLELSGKAAKPLEKEGVRPLLEAANGALENADWSSPAALDDALKHVAAEAGVGFSQIGQPLRAALTAGYASPSLGEILHALGREEGLGRLSDVIFK